MPAAGVGNARCDTTADACRRHARFLAEHPVDMRELIAAELEAVAK